jgi:Asp-tRNA(Asn)/Glu-tRNA(Gln) amidotransferase A subunit family amidase
VAADTVPGDTAGAAVDTTPGITAETLRAAERLFGLEFTREERELMLSGDTPFVGVRSLPQAYRSLRESPATRNDVPPALFFRPHPPAVQPEERGPWWPEGPWDRDDRVDRPADVEEVAFWPIWKLAELIRTGQVSSVELTRMYLDRLARHDSTLHAVVSLTRERALERARQMDRELARGEYRGILHGIPYGAKDLFAVEGTRTTWGAEPYRRQRLERTATVVSRLDSAGAVLVAKLSLGALAWGDVWFGARTRNPWNPEEGSSGSSAGSAAAVSAGLVPFALGTETLGSIVSPSTRTGVTGLRPSFGRVSRHGAMVVAWSMDKVGPICRYAGDCAVVFQAIRGHDPADPTTVRDIGFPWRQGSGLDGLRIGYLESAFRGDYDGAEADRRTLEVLRGLGADLVPLELPDLPVGSMGFVLGVEAAAAHDSLTRSNRDTLLVRQEADAWPNVFRSARFIPAVEYLQAQQLRRVLGQEMAETLSGVDVYVSPAFRGRNLLATNLTGHPCVVVPNGFTDADSPTSVTFCGRMYGEAAALEVAEAYQDETPWEERTPPAFTP